MVVEKAHLADHGRADELVDRRVLRAGFETAAAADAATERVALFLELLGDGGAGAEVVGTVDRDPGFDALEVVEEPRAIDEEVADERELTHRLERDDVVVGFGFGFRRSSAAGYCRNPRPGTRNPRRPSAAVASVFQQLVDQGRAALADFAVDD